MKSAPLPDSEKGGGGQECFSTPHHHNEWTHMTGVRHVSRCSPLATAYRSLAFHGHRLAHGKHTSAAHGLTKPKRYLG